MKRLIAGSFIVSILVFFSACKGSTTPEPATVTSITVTSANSWFVMGDTEKFTATVTKSDGTQEAATGTWSSDDEYVATVDNTGLVTILHVGVTDIIMKQGGKTGSKSIRSVSDIQGYYNGIYRVAACGCSGDFLSACNSFPTDTELPIALHVTQFQDSFTGTIYLGQHIATLTGEMAENGDLIMRGIATANPFSIAITLNLWSVDAPGEITFILDQYWTGSGYSGYMDLSSKLDTLNRNSPRPDEASIMARPLLTYPTVQDAINAIRIR